MNYVSSISTSQAWLKATDRFSVSPTHSCLCGVMVSAPGCWSVDWWQVGVQITQGWDFIHFRDISLIILDEFNESLIENGKNSIAAGEEMTNDFKPNKPQKFKYYKFWDVKKKSQYSYDIICPVQYR